MGGGMRQAGILAAAGMYALDHNVERLAEDHKRAAALAEVIKGLGKVKFVIPPETNILIFDVDPAIGETRILEELELSGLRGVAFGKNRIRLVTHLNIGDKELAMALKILRKVLS
jgi:threonine aldolase